MFILYILLNMSNLTNIPYSFPLGAYTINGTFNLYAFIAVACAIYLVVIIAGVNAIGSGLTSGSVSTLRKLISILFIYVLCSVGSINLLTNLGYIGGLIIGLLILFFAIGFFDKMQGGNEDD